MVLTDLLKVDNGYVLDCRPGASEVDYKYLGEHIKVVRSYRKNDQRGDVDKINNIQFI